MTLESITMLGNAGNSILNKVGKEYGQEMINKLKITKDKDILSRLEKINLLTETSNFLGLHASFTYDENTDELIYNIKNYQFKELASKQDYLIRNMNN